MSDSDKLSRESSLSLFSGIGTSSVSGGSDIGIGTAAVNIDELSDKKLENLLEENRTILRQIVLETLMFESYYERLLAGLIVFSPSSIGDVGNGARGSITAMNSSSRKGSYVSGVGGDTISDSDSQILTTGNSLLDVSNRSLLSYRKRSSSRTSLGSRVKSLRLSEQQKCGIADKEHERIVKDLQEFRNHTHHEIQEGMSQVLEMNLRLDELVKHKKHLIDQINDSKVKIYQNYDPLKKQQHSNTYDYQKLEQCFNYEVLHKQRFMRKLQTKNGVLESQIKRQLNRIQMEKSSALESGPVNLEHLDLERTNILSELEIQNQAVVAKRKELSTTKWKRIKAQDDLKEKTKNQKELLKDLKLAENSIKQLQKVINEAKQNINLQNQTNLKMKNKIEIPSMLSKIPTTDDYFQLKLKEMEIIKSQKLNSRKQYLEKLKKSVAKQKIIKEKSEKQISSANKIPQLQEGGQLVLGKTFNLMFNLSLNKDSPILP